MFVMVRILVALVVCGAAVQALAQKPKILVAPVDVLDSKALPSWDKKATQIEVGRAVEQHLAQRLFESGMDTLKAVQADQLLEILKKGVKGDAVRSVNVLDERASDAGAEYILFAQVVRWSQKNRSTSEILRSPTTAPSETKVEVRLWLYDRKNATLISDGNRSVLEGVFAGPYIGTQVKGELTGNPEDVARSIAQTNKQRLAMIGKAAGAAVKSILERIKP